MTFALGQQVRITRHGSLDEFNGRTGTVVRLCAKPYCAWVQADHPLPANLRCYPSDDPRRDDIHLFDTECELA